MEAREILHSDLQWTSHTRFTLSSGLKTGYPTLFHSKNKVCSSQSWDNTPINNTKDLIEAYPDQFDRIGNFAGEYHIVLRPNNHPIVHAPRKCSIHIRDEVKAELNEMVSQGIIQKVDEPTDWVSSIVYVCKSNGKLRLCLDPKDLNKAIMRYHYKTTTME